MPKIRYVAVPDPDARGARTGGATERNPPSLAEEKEKEGGGGGLGRGVSSPRERLQHLAPAADEEEEEGARAYATAAVATASLMKQHHHHQHDPAGIVRAFNLEPCALPPTPQPATAAVAALLQASLKPVVSIGEGGGAAASFFFGESTAAALTLEGTSSPAPPDHRRHPPPSPLAATSTSPLDGSGEDIDGGGDATMRDAAARDPQHQQQQHQQEPGLENIPSASRLELLEVPVLSKPRQLSSTLKLLARGGDNRAGGDEGRGGGGGDVGQEWPVVAGSPLLDEGAASLVVVADPVKAAALTAAPDLVINLGQLSTAAAGEEEEGQEEAAAAAAAAAAGDDGDAINDDATVRARATNAAAPIDLLHIVSDGGDTAPHPSSSSARVAAELGAGVEALSAAAGAFTTTSPSFFTIASMMELAAIAPMETPSLLGSGGISVTVPPCASLEPNALIDALPLEVSAGIPDVAGTTTQPPQLSFRLHSTLFRASHQ